MHRLLLEVARVAGDPAALRAAASTVGDWNVVISDAARHGLRPLLYQRLKSCCRHLVPSGTYDSLRAAFHANAARNLLHANELCAVTTSLEAAGIATIAFKGPTLAAWAYGDIALREFADLDLLVKEAEKDRAMTLLKGNGCSLIGRGGAEELSGNCEVALRTPNGCSLDLHWQIAPPYFPRFDDEPAWNRARRVPLARHEVDTFCAEDLLTCLSMHGAVHCWESFGWVSDVAHLLAVTPLDWHTVYANPSTQRIVRVALLLASGLLNARVPPNVLEVARRDHVALGVANELGSRLVGGVDTTGRTAGAALHLRMLTTVADKGRYIWRRTLKANQNDNDLLRLPSELRPLLYVLRPLRLLTKLASRS